MKIGKYSIGASLLCLATVFTLLHFVNESGTAADNSKSAACSADQGCLVGTVVMWWGSRDEIPSGWEICNGQKAQTSAALLTGNKPNLIDRFPKGATASRKTIDDLSQGIGGSHNMPALQIARIDGLKIAEDGEHSHTSLDLAAANADDIKQVAGESPAELTTLQTKRSAKQTKSGDNELTVTEGRHSHQLNGFVGTEGGVSADGDDKSGANQPAFAELFFIIRVK